MSNYYTYVNHTLRERVDLDPWIASGGTMQEAHAILFGGVLAYLMFPTVEKSSGWQSSERKFRGRWGVESCPDRGDYPTGAEMARMRNSAQVVVVLGDYTAELRRGHVVH